MADLDREMTSNAMLVDVTKTNLLRLAEEMRRQENSISAIERKD